jgi:hypothetical protein
LPDLGLSTIKALASGPARRAYHNIIKPDDSTILMFGGTREQVLCRQIFTCGGSEFDPPLVHILQTHIYI